MPPYLQDLVSTVGSTAGKFLWALVILVIGWIIALIIRNILRGLLRRTTLDDKIAKVFTDAGGTKPFDASYWISQIVYYILLLIVIVAALEQLGLTAVTVPLNAFLATIWGWIPGLWVRPSSLSWPDRATLVRWLLRSLFDPRR
jgi:small-conductance mechanosensitive channel